MICQLRCSVASCHIGAAACLAALTVVIPAYAVEPSAQTVGALFNWYYTTSFGTGVYSIGDTTVTAVALPFHYTMREPNEIDWGWQVTLPVTTALGNFDLYDPDLGQIDNIRLAAVSVMPGFEFIIPIKPHWRLSSFANIGKAWELETQTSATLYQAGVSTRYDLATVRYPEIAIGGKYVYAGYRTPGDDSTPISLIALGIDATIPTTWTLASGRQVKIGLHWIGASYITDIRFKLPEFGYTGIHGEHELGITFGLRPAVKFLGASLDRIGFGYVVASNGLRGIRLVTEFPF